jgi:hypothetical protein
MKNQIGRPTASVNGRSWAILGFDRGEACEAIDTPRGADQSSMDFRRENSTRLRGRGKSSDEKGRTIGAFQGWEGAHSFAFERQNFLLNSAPLNLDAELKLPFSSDRFASRKI